MQKMTHKFIAMLLCGVMLWTMWSVSGLSVAAADTADELFSAGETGHTTSALGKSGLAFRFAVTMPGADYTAQRRLVLRNARVRTEADGTCSVKRVGVVMSSLAMLLTHPEQLTLDLAATKRVDVPAVYVENVRGEQVSFTARIDNIEPKKKNRVVYARPYVIYSTATGECKTLYGAMCSDNSSGLHRGYRIAMDNPGWVSGSVSRTTGGVVDDGTAVRSRFINHPNLMIRLPKGYKATAFIHTLDSFVTMDITEDWTTLASQIPDRAKGVRLTVWREDGAPISNPSEVGKKIGVYAAAEDGVLPLAFSTNSGITYRTATVTTIKNQYLTDLLPVQDVALTARGDARYTIFYYNKNKQFLYSNNLAEKQATRIAAQGMGEAAYFRIQAQRTDTKVWGTTQLECTGNIVAYLPGSKTYNKAYRADGGKTLSLYRDVPENQGVKNALLNMEQLTKIVYTTKAVLPQNMGDYPAQQPHQGLPYSSTRIEGTYVPNNVSFHTFMTAIQNPNSYLYTTDLGRDFGNVNGDTVYGSVCSTACTYALGIVANYTTSQWKKVPGMIQLKPGSQSLKLCDTIVGNSHVVMVTDVVRDGEGNVLQCVISEADGVDVKARYRTADHLDRLFPADTYAFCRYTKLADVQHTPSEYVAVGDQSLEPVAYNTAIIPRRGDKANWYYGTDVVLDVLEKGDYTAVEVYKNEAHFNTILLDASNVNGTGHVITQQGLPAGSYKARLINETDASAWCYWIVTDASFTATPQEDYTVKIEFAATNAEPLFVQWTNATNNGAYHTTELTPEQIAQGVAVVTPPSRAFRIRVAFRTEYGIVYTQIQDGITMPTTVPKS